MRLHPCCVVVLMLLLVPTSALANDHVARIAGGYSKLKSSSFDGGHGSVEVTLPFGKEYVGVVIDSSVNAGTDAGVAVTKAAALFGVRGSLRPGRGRFVLFATVLPLGFHRSHIGDVATNGKAFGAGFGGDILINGIGTTATPPRSGWIASAQADWVRIAGDTSLRINAGIGYRYR